MKKKPEHIYTRRKRNQGLYKNRPTKNYIQTKVQYS
jgi:hypothetical protein